MDTKTKLENALKEAMRAGDDIKKRTVRMALAAIKQAEVDRQTSLDEAAVLAILPSRCCAQKEIKMRGESLEEARQANRPDLVAAAEAAQHDERILSFEEHLHADGGGEQAHACGYSAFQSLGQATAEEHAKTPAEQDSSDVDEGSDHSILFAQGG